MDAGMVIGTVIVVIVAVIGIQIVQTGFAQSCYRQYPHFPWNWRAGRGNCLGAGLKLVMPAPLANPHALAT